MLRIRNSWELAKVSWSVLRADKSLAVFPTLAAVVDLVVVGIFAGLVALTGVDSAHGGALNGIAYVIIAVGYIAMAFVTTYFLGALVHGANEALEGRRAELSDCFAAANARLHRILPWALIQATVSMILQVLENVRGVGPILRALLGTAWAVLTFLTIPIIMFEDRGPIDALERSGSLLKRSWGENLTAQFGFGFLTLIAAVPAFVLFGAGGATGNLAAVIVTGAIGAAWFVIVLLVVSALTGIYRTALYRFAVDGVAPPAFANADLQHALGPRQQRRSGFGF